MKRVLATAVLLAFLPTTHAQDKGKPDFTHDAEFRVRDTFEQNLSGSKDVKPTHHNGIEQRFKLGLGFKANEKFSAHATLLQTSEWGQTQGEQGVLNKSATNTRGDQENFILANEAYGNWMVSEDFIVKFGRQNFSFGDDSVMAENDWEQHPYSFEGVVLNYEAEFGRFHIFGFKYQDLYSAPTAAQAMNSDPQHDAYGLVFDLKAMPEWVKMVNLYVIQDTADAIGNAAAGEAAESALNTFRWGLGVGFNFAMLDLKADYANESGKDVSFTPKKDVEASMWQAEIGLNIPSFIGSRIFLGMHQDTGTKDTDTTKIKTYNGYFHEKHCSAGCMDLFDWGNLTTIQAGWTTKPSDHTTTGIEYWIMQKTQKTGQVSAGRFGSVLLQGDTALQADLGSEADLWVEHEYGGGFSMTARLGAFIPGKALKNSETVNSTLTVKRDQTVEQAMLEARLTF